MAKTLKIALGLLICIIALINGNIGFGNTKPLNQPNLTRLKNVRKPHHGLFKNTKSENGESELVSCLSSRSGLASPNRNVKARLFELSFKTGVLLSSLNNLTGGHPNALIFNSTKITQSDNYYGPSASYAVDLKNGQTLVPRLSTEIGAEICIGKWKNNRNPVGITLDLFSQGNPMNSDATTKRLQIRTGIAFHRTRPGFIGNWPVFYEHSFKFSFSLMGASNITLYDGKAIQEISVADTDLVDSSGNKNPVTFNPSYISVVNSEGILGSSSTWNLLSTRPAFNYSFSLGLADRYKITADLGISCYQVSNQSIHFNGYSPMGNHGGTKQGIRYIDITCTDNSYVTFNSAGNTFLDKNKKYFQFYFGLGFGILLHR